MVEVPNAPPFVPHQPTLVEQKRDRATMILVGGVALVIAGVGVEAGAIVYAADNPCILPLACLFGPPHDSELVTFGALAVSGLMGVAGGIALTVVGGSMLSKLHRNLLSLRLGAGGVSLSGRF